MTLNFLEKMHEKVLLADGALGTYLYEKGIDLGANTDLLNLLDPELIYSVHEEYIRAGSEVIETNTFGANRFKLMKSGRADQVEAINRRGVEIARKAAGKEIFVAGSVGPTGVIFPLDNESVGLSEVEGAYREQIGALIDAGVDLVILETFTYLEEMLLALGAVRSLAGEIPVVAQMLYPSQGRTAQGLEAVECASAALEAGADVVGTNCGRGVKAMLEAVERLSQLGSPVPLSAFPNAGIPEVVDHRTVYSTPPSYMAEKVAEMVKMGVRLIGGCCGTTPAHIHEFRQALHIKRPAASKVRVEDVISKAGEATPASSARGEMLSGLTPGRIPVLVELDPPPHLDVGPIIEGAKALAAQGVDAITLAENPLAVLRADNLSLAHLIREEVGIHTVLHMTCRDRNVLGLQAQIMAAHLLGIRAILAITGDPATSSDQPGVSGVFDVNSMGLVRMITGFNRGVNMAGSPMKNPTDFSIGVALSYRPSRPDLQLRRLEKKAEMGAHFVMTQPIFDRFSAEAIMEKTSHLNLAIFPGIFPLISARNAEFLHHEVPGISIPREVREKMARYSSIEDQRRRGLELAQELVSEIAPFVDGLYLISPLNKWEVPLELVREVRQRGIAGSGRFARAGK